MLALGMRARWRDVYPSAEKDVTEARLALQTCVGPPAIVKASQRGGARELIKTAADLGICPSTSHPYVSHSNSVTERAIRHVEEGSDLVAMGGEVFLLLMQY